MVGGEQRSRRSFDLHRYVGREMHIFFCFGEDRKDIYGVLSLKEGKGVKKPGLYVSIGNEEIHLPIRYTKKVPGPEKNIKVEVLKGSHIETQLKNIGLIE